MSAHPVVAACGHSACVQNHIDTGEQHCLQATTAQLGARLVRTVKDAGMVREDFGPAVDLIAAMEVRGYGFAGLNSNPRQRAELQGQPKFYGLCGPMWDGDAIRYEDAAANAALSA